MIGKPIKELPTPALLIDEEIVQRNLRRAAEIARRSGKKLRPHIKAHKILEFARMQIELGAAGICTAKVSEAEVMAEVGIQDIFIANEIVGEDKLKRLAVLAGKVKITVLADSLEAVDLLGEIARRYKVKIYVMAEVETGDCRCGAPKEEILSIALRIRQWPELCFAGIETFGGWVFHCESREQELSNVADLAGQLRELKKELMEHDILVEEVSVGGSPAFALLAEQEGISELRPGVYIFNDAATVSRQGAAFEDCGVTVLTTVISRPVQERMIVDGGAKTFSYCCPGIVYGKRILYGVLKNQTDLCLSRLSEEHGVFEAEAEVMSKYKVGDKLQVIPAHACPVINLFDYAYLCRDGIVTKVIPIAARGMME